ncbi:MAG: beta-galactosidase [Phycisphaerales bacterium]
MATLSSDGQSLLIDSKRHWIISGTVGYAGLPRDLWAPRLRAAKSAGLNTIVVPAVWAHHQKSTRSLDFEGDRDIASFIRMAGLAGLHVIVRVGPVVDRAIDLGGMPSMLLGSLDPAEALRSSGPEFLSFLSTWIRTLSGQIAPLQVTERRDASPSGGPIIGVQAEHEFTCGDPELAETYLAVITRYLREGAIRTPIFNTNNLVISAEGEIETWSGYTNLHATVRQLRVAKRDQPRIVGELRSGTEPRWGVETSAAKTASMLERKLAEVLAAGGQFNIAQFARGARLGFTASQGVTTSTAGCDLIDDAGRSHPSLPTVRRLCTFASSFASVLAGVEPDFQPAMISPSAVAAPVIDEETGERAPGKPACAGYAVEFCRGSQGSIAFVFGDDQAGGKRGPAILTLPDGTPIEVELGRSAVAWVLLRTHLFGRATLDYCSLRALCRFGEVFVCFGPAGTTGSLSINGTPAEVLVPKGKTPTIETIEGVRVVVLSEQMADAAMLDWAKDPSATPVRLLIGAAAISDQGVPIRDTSHKQVLAIDPQGNLSTTESQLPLEPSASRIALSSWERAGEDHHTSGSADQFAMIDGPTNMDALGVPAGYGWLRITLKNSATKKTSCAMLESADRLHLYMDGQPATIVGDGPGAVGRILQLPLAKGEQTIGVLVDNLGRPADRSDLRDPKGLFGHIYASKAFKAGSPSIENGPPLDLLDHFRPVLHVYRGDRTSARRLSWSFMHRRKSALALVLEEVAWRGVLLLNDQPIKLIEPGVPIRAVLTSEMLRQGNNTVQIALLEPSETVERSLADIRRQASWYELASNLTEKAGFAFAPWGPPEEDRFEPAAKASMNGAASRKRRGYPAWWRCRFSAPLHDRPLILDLAGLSKGQVLLNGHNAGRYFVQTPDGKPVPPHRELCLPPCWLNEDEQPANELLIFDESGFSPDKVKLGYAPIG